MLLLAAFALGAPFILVAISLVQPVLLVRTLAWAGGPAWIVLAVALARHAEPRIAWIGIGAVAAIEVAALVAWMPTRQREAWPAALAAIARASPNATVVVESDAMALAARSYRVPGIDIVAVAPDDFYDAWAQGLYPGKHASAEQARALLRRRRDTFALVRGAHDRSGVLAAAGKGEAMPVLTQGRAPIVWRWRATGD